MRVLAGLSGDEEVVTSAQFMLDSESRLQEAIRKMLQERTQSGAQPAGEASEAMPEMVSTAPEESDAQMHHQH